MTEMSPAEAILFAALEKKAEQRAAYLDEACGGNADLRRRVERLLAAHPHVGNFLDLPANAASLADTVRQPPPSESVEGVGAVIAGRYKLLEAIGEGGMGSVFLAQQTEPVKRLVAVKLIRPGLDSGQFLARFEAERQALALMDHPNIARVLDAGTTESGRPFFVMELVKGTPITTYCDQGRLSPRQRLELFVPICEAIQHAHHKGIIHRDVKPSNVLIAQHDGKAVPKVIDFGVAKAIGQPLTDRTLVTGFGAIVGTLDYMAPEQAEINQLDIDTRCDVYSLGVLLYELLTGTTPLDRRRLKEAALLEVLRRVREEETPRASTRLSSSDALPRIAADRGTEPDHLIKLLRSELDWLLMKALDKDRTRRYETASGLAQDVERYLADEPVLACPPSAGYRLRKFLRRHRGPVLAATLLLVVLVGGIIGTSIGLVAADKAARQEREASRQAKDAADRAKTAETDALAKAHLAEMNRIEATKVKDLLIDAFRKPDPYREGDSVTVASVLSQSLKEIDKLDDQPAVQEELLAAIGTTLYSLKVPEAAAAWEKVVALRRNRLPPDHPDISIALNNLALADQVAGNAKEALPLLEEVLQFRQEHLGRDHPDTLLSRNNLALCYEDLGQLQPALRHLKEVLALRQEKQGRDDPATLAALSNLAVCYMHLGDFTAALPYLEDAFHLSSARLGAENPDTIKRMGNLGSGYIATGKVEDGLKLERRALDLQKKVFGPEHPDTAGRMGELAHGYIEARDPRSAVPLYQESLKIYEDKLGPVHPETLRARNNLAVAYGISGDRKRQIELSEETLKTVEARLGPEHPLALQVKVNWAYACVKLKKDGSLPLFEKTVEAMKKKFGYTLTTLRQMNNLAVAYYQQGDKEKALRLHKEVLDLRTSKLGASHPDTLSSMREIAICYENTGKPELALPYFEKVVELRKEALGPDARLTIDGMYDLVLCYQEAGKPDQTIPLANSFAEFSLQMLRNKQYVLANVLLRQCLAIRLKTEPDSWRTFEAKAMLGSSLLGLKKYPEAEPLLKEGYEGMTAREQSIPQSAKVRLAETVERLVQLYQETDRQDEAAKWAKVLDDLKLRDKGEKSSSRSGDRTGLSA